MVYGLGRMNHAYNPFLPGVQSYPITNYDNTTMNKRPAQNAETLNNNLCNCGRNGNAAIPSKKSRIRCGKGRMGGEHSLYGRRVFG